MKPGDRAAAAGDPATPIGRRIHVTGNSCAGKSTLGARLAEVLDVPFVELDALNWQPDWVGLNDTDPEELERQIDKATDGDGWVVAGSYMGFSQRVFWPRLETVIWLDLPMHRLLWRVLIRSWHRRRTKELLWGANYERFWPQLMVWKKEESLVWWITTQHRRKRSNMQTYMAEPHWCHIRFLRLRSSTEIAALLHDVRVQRGSSGQPDESGESSPLISSPHG